MARSSYTSDKMYTLTDAQLESLAASGPFALRAQPSYIQEAVALWEKKGRAGEVVLQSGKARYVSADDDDDGPAGTQRAPSALPTGIPRGVLPGVRSTPSSAKDLPMGTSNIWYHSVTGTGTQTEQSVQPNDPFLLSDVKFESDDSTARITSIKQGSTELLAGSGSGVRVSQFNSDGVLRAAFAGRRITRDNPLKFTVVHAGSGTNTTVCQLLGTSERGDCAI